MVDIMSKIANNSVILRQHCLFTQPLKYTNVVHSPFQVVDMFIHHRKHFLGAHGSSVGHHNGIRYEPLQDVSECVGA